MSKNETNMNNTPRLRFSCFSNDWNEKVLGEVIDVIKGQQVNNTELTDDSTMFPMLNGGSSISGYYKDYNTPANAITISEGGNSCGFVNYMKVPFWAGGHCYVVKPLIKIDNEFLFQVLKHKESEIMRLRVGSGLPNIQRRALLDDISISLPFNPAEQQKIASCLAEKDNLIASQGQKVDALKEKKKGLMQQLFPQPGETVPRMRFPGFTGDWKEKELSDCLEERNEQFPEDENYPLMAFVAEKGVSPKGEKYDRSALVKDATNKKYKRTELGDFIYSSNNLESGSIGFNTYGPACISPVYSIFKSKNNVEPVFIGTLLTQKSFISEMIKYRQGVVYGQWKIPEREFLRIKVLIPSPEEQLKIAQCLTALDKTISAEADKLDALKNHKKGLMQQLFPQPAK